MSATVIKLGSSIVADERGEVRTDVLAQVCDQAVGEWRERVGDRVLDVLGTSAATGPGVEVLKAALMRLVPEGGPAPPGVGLARHPVFPPGPDEGF